MEYEDFELQIGPLSHEGLHVRVLRSPAGEARELVQLPSLTGDPEILLGNLRHLNVEASGLPSSPAELGSALFQSVLAGQVGSLFHESLGRIESPSRGLRMRLQIDPQDLLQGLPWELLYRRDTQEFLALSRETPIVRSPCVPRRSVLRSYQPPLRILAVLARDPESSPLGLEEELEQLRKALERNPAIRLEILEDPDTQAIRNTLDHKAFHILHYMGHGVFEPESGEGALLFGGPEGRLSVSGRHLAAKVRGLNALRLVVLNACETAIVGGETPQGPFAGVAAALVLGGIPAVVAMQSSIRDAHSIAFTSAFYAQLAKGRPVEEAVTEGRQAILSSEPDSASWAIPVLFLRATGDLFAQGKRILVKVLLWGLLVIALGAGFIGWLVTGSSGSRDDATSDSPTRPETRGSNPDTAQIKSALSLVAKLDSETAYENFALIIKQSPNSEIVNEARVWRVIISAAEVAAFYQLFSDIYTGGLSKIHEDSKPSFSVLFLNTMENINIWGTRLLASTEDLSLLRADVHIEMREQPDLSEIYTSGMNFNQTRDKILAGSAPSTAEKFAFERLARYMFLSTTIGKTLDIQPAPGKLGYLLRWKGGNLEGKVDFDRLFQMASASLIAYGSILNARGERAKAIEAYSRAYELVETSLSRSESKIDPDQMASMKKMQQLSSDEIKKLKSRDSQND